MSEPPKKGRSIPAFTDQDLDDSFNVLFSEELDIEKKEGILEASIALINLTTIFICKTEWKLLYGKVHFDYPSLEMMLRRFHRDAFGVFKFAKYLAELEKEGRLKNRDAKEILEKVKSLGLRITSGEPRKTKVVAAFALWFCTFRPIYFTDYKTTGLNNETLNLFITCLNYWITSRYLLKFGDIELGQYDGDVRIERFKHDMMCRAITLSALEFFYGSIFRANELPEDNNAEFV